MKVQKIEDIKDVILDFEDETDFKFELKHSANFINLIGTTKNLNYNKLEFIKKNTDYEIIDNEYIIAYKTVKIDGTSVTSISAVSVSSTEATATATGANSVTAGNTITLVLSSNSAAVDVAFSIKVTR